MEEDTKDLYTRIGALYVGLVRMEESRNMVEEELSAQIGINSEQVKRENNMSARLGNALAHLEVHDPDTHKKIMDGETVPVLGDG